MGVRDTFYTVVDLLRGTDDAGDPINEDERIDSVIKGWSNKCLKGE